MSRSWCGLFAVLIVGGPACGEDFADPFAPRDPRAKTVFVPEPGGVRVLTPPPALTRLSRLPREWLAGADIGLGGDFEVSASFRVQRIGGPADEGDVRLAAVNRAGDRRYGLSVHANPRDGRCFRVTRSAPIRGRDPHHNTLVFPRKFDAGRVCVRRRGAAVVFLAADGPDAPLKELVRYAHDPALNPAPQLSVFQGHGADPVPVDVTLSDVRVEADRVLRGPDRPADPEPAAAASYPVTVDYAAAPANLLADLPRTDGGRGFQAEAGGVRIKPPGGGADPQRYWSRESRFVLEGDFEVGLRLDPAVLGPAAPGSHCDAGFNLEGVPGGAVSVAREGAGRDGPRYKVGRYSDTAKGGHWDIQSAPAGSGPCRLVARRAGAVLVVLTQDGGEAEPVELVRFPFPAGCTPRVKLFAFQGDRPGGPVDVLVSDFRVRAARVVDPDHPDSAVMPAAGAVLDGLPPAPRARKWRLLAWAAGGVGAAVLAAVGVAVARRSRPREGTS